MAVGEAPQNDATRVIIPAHENPWRGRLPAVLAPSWGSCAAGRPTGHAPATRPHLRDATTSRPPEDRSWWLAQERGETPPSPNPSSRAIGRCHAVTGLFDPVEGFCRFSGNQNPCGENTMNSTSAVLLTSFRMFGEERLLQVDVHLTHFRRIRFRTTRVEKIEFSAPSPADGRRGRRRSGRRRSSTSVAAPEASHRAA